MSPVGTRNQGAINCFGRKSGELYDGPAATVKYGAGDTVDLKLIGTADGFTLIYGDNETASTGFDYALTAIDSDYIYVGFYVGTQCKCHLQRYPADDQRRFLRFRLRPESGMEQGQGPFPVLSFA